jgi:DNA-binding transcriptional LysR family regulator
MLDLIKLETFRVVAATSNFTRAADELGCCQSTVTVHIQELERELGVQLFDRCRFSKKVVLTEAGRCTLEYASRLFTLAHEAKAAAAEADAAGLTEHLTPTMPR